jgi:LPS-assembly protein
MIGRPAYLSLLISVLLVAFTAAPQAAEMLPPSLNGRKAPVTRDDSTALIRADSITYDESLGFIVARGNVEIVRGDRILMADTLTYNERDDVATANGNVVTFEPDGDVLFADRMVLTDGLKSGVIDQLRLLWIDNTRFAMEKAVLVADKEKRLSHVVMSPCKLCEEDPTRAPLWQIKADEVVHDEVDRYIHVYDAWLEMFGIPVAYTPYLAFPDPTLKRRSGILTPSVGFDGELGYTAQVPYFWNIAPNADITLSPLLTTKERVALFTEYRQHFGDGLIEVNGSGTYVRKRDSDGALISGNELRGHIEGHGEFDINNTFRWGFDLHRATDKRYLRRYGLNAPTTLTSGAYIEGFNGRNYVSGRTFFFQGQRDSDFEGDTPIVAPVLDLNYVGEPNEMGARWGLDASLLNIIRTDSTNTFRFAVAGEWVLPYTFEDGQIVTITASVLSEFYWADLLDDPDGPDGAFGPTHEVTSGRLYPQVVFDWRYPWARRSGTTQQIIEPVVAVVIAPPDPNFTSVPNEDSLDLNFSDANLLAHNRFPGIDRLDGGQRIAYGLNAGVYGDGGGYSSIFIGQSVRLYGETEYPTNSGLDSSFSDIVGRVLVQPLDWASVTARFRLDKDDFAARVIELSSDFYFDPVQFGIDYTFVDEIVGEVAIAKREEVSADFRVQIDDYWYVAGSHRHDLAGGDPLRSALGAYYSDDCFDLALQYQRRFFRDLGFAGDNQITLTLTYKHLGEIGTGI